MESLEVFLRVGQILSSILSFLLLTPWGWGILGFWGLIVLVKQGISGDGKWRWNVFVLNLSEKMGSLLISLPQIVIALVFLFAIAFFDRDIRLFVENLRLAREKTVLAQTLKNLRFEGKILEITVAQHPSGYELVLSYFTHSPWQQRPLLKHQERIVVGEQRVYVDFGVCNFDYTVVGEGGAYNLAFPYRLYTARQSPERGYSLFSGEKGILWHFAIPEEELLGMEGRDFFSMGQKIVASITNASLAKKLGIRTFYGQALALDLVPGKRYEFVTTGTGGVKLLP
ncbi:hypothetical protein [Thermospira aquatica]|uniref:Uncharacterized protein n=1 Tax=Thermospira aquatica TaxID=2828656 RepID=A0AAX3BDI8_9SPIR|nr:hypothetical protein [Thermospira aquatica]URA10296.1 hypothetical protein KDW03_00380 [Thermospira aquatica]